MASSALGKLPLIVIVGPTASGKTSLAVTLAKKFKGEIVCADSRTIYKDMDIGTAKPTAEERKAVPHWGLDLIKPNERFTVVDFKRYANQKVKEIRARGNVPFLVGGTGLYIDAVIFDYEFEGSELDEKARHRLESMTVKELHNYCLENNIIIPENKHNKRYVIRAIEQRGVNTKRRSVLTKNTLVVGISTEREKLRRQMYERAEQLLANGVVEEATLLGKKYGWENEAMTGNLYRLIHAHILGVVEKGDMVDKATTADWRLAKRQLTWFRRNSFVHWHSLEEAKVFLDEMLANR